MPCMAAISPYAITPPFSLPPLLLYASHFAIDAIFSFADDALFELRQLVPAFARLIFADCRIASCSLDIFCRCHMPPISPALRFDYFAISRHAISLPPHTMIVFATAACLILPPIFATPPPHFAAPRLFLRRRFCRFAALPLRGHSFSRQSAAAAIDFFISPWFCHCRFPAFTPIRRNI